MSLVIRDMMVNVGGNPLLRVPSVTLEAGAVTGITGGSGSGKSLFCQSLAGLAEPNWKLTGQCEMDNVSILSDGSLRMRPGKDSCWIGSDPRGLLDPLQRCGTQLVDAYRANHPKSSKSTAQRDARAMLVQLGIDDADRRMRNYPHEISGGMAQRIVIAAALLTDAPLIVLDDALVGLDATLEIQIAELVRSIVEGSERYVLFSSHDPLLAKHVSDSVYFLHDGRMTLPSDAGHAWAEYMALVKLDDAVEGAK